MPRNLAFDRPLSPLSSVDFPAPDGPSRQLAGDQHSRHFIDDCRSFVISQPVPANMTNGQVMPSVLFILKTLTN